MGIAQKQQNQHRTLRSASVQALEGKEKRFNTEGTDVGACLRRQAQSSQRRDLAWDAAEFLEAVTAHGVVVYHAGGLHQRVANCGADEAEAALRQVLA